MSEINLRLAEVREAVGLTTREFGKRLNMSGGAITNMEKGTRNVTERTVSDICREFNVNRNFLVDGIGDMFDAPVENEIIKKATILLGEKDPLFEAFIETYSRMSKEKRAELIEFGEELVKNIKKRK